MPNRICLIEGCETKVYSRGVCRNHYEQWRRGKPIPLLPNSQPQGIAPIVKLMKARVIVDRGFATPCWESTYKTNLHLGYAVIFGNGKVLYAHRVGYEHFIGPIPAGLTVDHLCRNRACWNAADGHLEAVTRGENVRRGDSPGAKEARRKRDLP